MKNILVIGGTKYFGIPMIEDFLLHGHEVTIATRGSTKDNFGNSIRRIRFDLFDKESVKRAFANTNSFDIVVDKISYSSNEIRSILEATTPKRFIHMSTANVYEANHFNMDETEFSGYIGNIRWNDRMEASYEENKRNAERVICQHYNSLNWVTVRYPIVLGKNDYTKRLWFYVDHIVNKSPMRIDNMQNKLCFINEDEAGLFMSYVSTSGYKGAINGASKGVISIGEIVHYIENKTGVEAIIDSKGDSAPFNNVMSNSLSVKKAKEIGWEFSSLSSWIYNLIDFYVDNYEEG